MHTLTIAGPVTEPWYADSIRNYIDTYGLGDRVKFMPERVNAVEQMKRASTVLVCSRNEALGRITLEALAAGRTVIGSQGGGTEMLLSDARGIFYDGTIPDLTRKLDDLEWSKKLLQPAEDRRQYVVDNFSPVNERSDFLDSIAAAKEHHEVFCSSEIKRQIGKSGVFDAMRAMGIIA